MKQCLLITKLIDVLHVHLLGGRQAERRALSPGGRNRRLSVKMETIPPFVLQDIIFLKCDLNNLFLDVVNFVLLLGKYHIHTSKWKKC